MNNLPVYIYFLLGWFGVALGLIFLLIKKKFLVNEFTSHLVSITTVIGFLFAVYTFELNQKLSERSMQPAIIFFNAGGPVGKDRWAFSNVGKEPALNVVISYRKSDNEKWTDNKDRSLGFSGIASDGKCFLLMNIEGPKSLIAEYEDIKGNLWTTIINDNKNEIKSISKWEQKFKSPNRQQWQLNPVKESHSGCIGIQI